MEEGEHFKQRTQTTRLSPFYKHAMCETITGFFISKTSWILENLPLSIIVLKQSVLKERVVKTK